MSLFRDPVLLARAIAEASDDYARSVFDAAVVGRTDRFVMRFRKPAR